MKTIEAKQCMLKAYSRIDDIVNAIQVINDESYKERWHDNSDMDKFVISILCNEVTELIEKLKNKL